MKLTIKNYTKYDGVGMNLDWVMLETVEYDDCYEFHMHNTMDKRSMYIRIEREFNQRTGLFLYQHSAEKGVTMERIKQGITTLSSLNKELTRLLN